MHWVSLAVMMFTPVLSTPSTPESQAQKGSARTPARVAPKAPAARPAPVKAKAAPASRPAARPVARKAAPTKAPVAARKVPAKPAKRAPKVASTKKEVTLPFVVDKSVVTTTLKNGLTAWCKPLSGTKTVHIRVGIAAGTSTDPKGLAGTARFLARLLEKRLNQPNNPPHSLLPAGGNQYKVEIQKDWITVTTTVSSKRVNEALKHIGKQLLAGPPQAIPSTMRKALKRSAGRFPPPSLDERVEAFLFSGQIRGALLRGKTRTFSKIAPFRLQTSHKELYQGHRIRLLVIGATDCAQTKGTVSAAFGPIKGEANNKKPLFTEANVRASRRMFLTQDLVHLYQLPTLYREDYLPLLLLQRLASKELTRALKQEFGGTFPLHTRLRTYEKHGYLLFVLPARSTRQRSVNKVLKNALGNLRMTPYKPALKQRLAMYLKTLQLSQIDEAGAMQAQADQLFAQLLLPAKKHRAPRSFAPLFKQMNPPAIRQLARKYMGQTVGLSSANRPFSLQRVLLFVVTLLLVWVLLDQTFRRSRRPEE
jgi:predicted Zn-dependent peptidase